MEWSPHPLVSMRDTPLMPWRQGEAPAADPRASVAIATLDADLSSFFADTLGRALPRAHLLMVADLAETMRLVVDQDEDVDAVVVDAALPEAAEILDGLAKGAPTVRRLLVVPPRLADVPLRAGDANAILAAPLDAQAVGRIVLEQVGQRWASRAEASAAVAAQHREA